jgi:glycosyltransferase involved in cell wall biosynthesis
MIILPGGADTKIISPVDRHHARQKLGLSPDEWIVGYMGALSAKEVDLLVETVRIVRGYLPQVRLLAIGVAVAGSRKSFRETVGNRWENWITETGIIPFTEVLNYLGACDALILPMQNTLSNRARWPSKINDYLAAGRPGVASRVGEVAAILDRYHAGLLAEDNPFALAQMLLKFSSNKILAKSYGDNGRILAEGDLNWITLVKGLIAYYERILNVHK